jgi:hypothetical protein
MARRCRRQIQIKERLEEIEVRIGLLRESSDCNASMTVKELEQIKSILEGQLKALQQNQERQRNHRSKVQKKFASASSSAQRLSSSIQRQSTVYFKYGSTTPSEDHCLVWRLVNLASSSRSLSKFLDDHQDILAANKDSFLKLLMLRSWITRCANIHGEIMAKHSLFSFISEFAKSSQE